MKRKFRQIGQALEWWITQIFSMCIDLTLVNRNYYREIKRPQKARKLNLMLRRLRVFKRYSKLLVFSGISISVLVVLLFPDLSNSLYSVIHNVAETIVELS